MSASLQFEPHFLGRDYWDFWDFPETIFDQKFGSCLDDSQLLRSRFRYPSLREWMSRRSELLRKEFKDSSGTSTVRNDPNCYRVLLDMSHFQQEEIAVKTLDDMVVIEAKHEERPDEHGLVSRQLTRKYLLPKGVEPEKVTCTLNSDGVLTITGPKKVSNGVKKNEHLIPIQMEQEAEKGKEKEKETSPKETLIK